MRKLLWCTRSTPDMSGEAKAIQPRDVTRLVAERLNTGDAAGVAALYEPGAVLACPADQSVTGREAIQPICQKMAGAEVRLAIETPLPRRRADPTWGVLLDDPRAFPAPPGPRRPTPKVMP